MKTSEFLRFKRNHPRRNLPQLVARKRGESNFVSSFSKTYVASLSDPGIGGKEFALAGFGIADFVWIVWRDPQSADEGSALSIEEIKSRLNEQKLTAFEMKLSDWRKGLSQAHRYSYFADLAVVVLPPAVAKKAAVEINLFRELNIGLWSFDPSAKKITRIFTPSVCRPRNSKAKQKAVDALGRSLQLGQFLK